MTEPYDSTDDTLAHIRQVGTFIADASRELVLRASRHDHSKLMPPEKDAFDRETPSLALRAHYAANSHHPEHYGNGIAGMDLFDLVELVADWKAAAMRMQDGSDNPNLEHNVERFGIDPQLACILQNTLERWPRSNT